MSVYVICMRVGMKNESMKKVALLCRGHRGRCSLGRASSTEERTWLPKSERVRLEAVSVASLAQSTPASWRWALLNLLRRKRRVEVVELEESATVLCCVCFGGEATGQCSIKVWLGRGEALDDVYVHVHMNIHSGRHRIVPVPLTPPVSV